MEADEETLLRKLQEVASGPGGATAGNVDSGELLLLARCFSADLRSICERVPVQLAVPQWPAGPDSMSLSGPARKRRKHFFRRVEKLVAGEVPSSKTVTSWPAARLQARRTAGCCRGAEPGVG